MLYLWLCLGFLFALFLLVYLGGALLPAAHQASSTITLRAKPVEVFAAIDDWRSYPTWRRELTGVEPLPGADGWIESLGRWRLPLRVERREPPHLLVTRIADDRLPFGGTWTWRVEPTPAGGTRVTTTEDGVIHSPPFRLLARFVFGHHRSLHAVQRALGAKFGDTVEPGRG